MTASISKLLHSWLFIDLSEHHYTALTSKFNNFFNRSSMMLNNVILTSLKGKFSSGIEGALASTLNHDFNWKQLSEMILCIFLLKFSKFIWVKLILKQNIWKRDFAFWAWAYALYYDLKYNQLDTSWWRTYLFQDVYTCKYCVPILLSRTLDFTWKQYCITPDVCFKRAPWIESKAIMINIYSYIF